MQFRLIKTLLTTYFKLKEKLFLSAIPSTSHEHSSLGLRALYQQRTYKNICKMNSLEMLLEKITSKSEIFSRRERVGVKQKAENESCRVTKLINILKKIVVRAWAGDNCLIVLGSTCSVKRSSAQRKSRKFFFPVTDCVSPLRFEQSCNHFTSLEIKEPRAEF